MKHQKRIASVLVTLSILLGAHVATAADTTSGHTLLGFQASALGVMRDTSSNTFTGHLAWTPRFGLTESFGIRAAVGASLFKGNLGGMFPVLDAQALASLGLTSWFFEAGGGVQMWIGESVTAPMVSGTGAYRLSSPMFGLVDQFFLSYAYVLGGAGTHQARLGVGISL